MKRFSNNISTFDKRKYVAIAILLLLFLIFSCGPKNADTSSSVFYIYLELGFTHIIPLGLDHILFILGLFLLKPKLKPILWQATTFTIAHSITLGLAMAGRISISAAIIEPVIALSILYVAVENILTERLRPTRLIVVFIFGLIHGLGFAGALKDFGLPKQEFISSLLGFNLGVELGQAAIIIAAWCTFGYWFSNRPWYHKFIVIPFSLAIGAVALLWAIQRIFHV